MPSVVDPKMASPEFSTIVGVGQAKLARYGEQFIELIRGIRTAS